MSFNSVYFIFAFWGRQLPERERSPAVPRSSILVLLLFSTICYPSGEVDKEFGLTYLVIEDQVAPFQISTSDNPLEGGLVTQLVEETISGTPLKMDTFVAPWLRLKKSIMNGNVNNWLVYGSREWLFPGAQLSDIPIMRWHHVIASRRADSLDLQGLNQLFGKTLLLVLGYDYPGLDPWLKSTNNGPIEDFRVNLPEQAIHMLSLGRGDAVIDIDLRIDYQLRKLQLRQDQFKFRDFSDVIRPMDIYLMFDEKMPVKSIQIINERLKELNSSGYLERMVKPHQLVVR